MRHRAPVAPRRGFRPASIAGCTWPAARIATRARARARDRGVVRGGTAPAPSAAVVGPADGPGEAWDDGGGRADWKGRRRYAASISETVSVLPSPDFACSTYSSTALGPTMTDDKDRKRLLHEEANKTALAAAQEELGHARAAEGTRTEAQGLRDEIRSSLGESRGKSTNPTEQPGGASALSDAPKKGDPPT